VQQQLMESVAPPAHRKKIDLQISVGASAARRIFRRRRREYVSGWRGGGIRRLTGLLANEVK